MRIGIVGSEQAKFTSLGEERARSIIRKLLQPPDGSRPFVVSGGCHLGGVDSYAVEEAKLLGNLWAEHLPKIQQWEGGYKQRNILIAQDSDYVVCITVKQFPKEYDGLRFSYCYHCKTNEHIKSGGCWTVKIAKQLGRRTDVFVVDNYKEESDVLSTAKT